MSELEIDRAAPFESGTASAFIGRKRELFALGSALQDARAGLGTIFLLSGEAGTGKTFLVSEFSNFARANGAKVLRGRASARLRDVPFGVWKQALFDYPSHDDGRLLPTDSASPEVISAPLAAHHAWSQPFESMTRKLAEHARTPPLVLVLDDLHSADLLSLRAFRVLAREFSRTGTLVIGVYRDSATKRFQEFADLLVDPLIRDCKRLSLTAFNAVESREFARSKLPDAMDAMDEQTLAALRNLTGGNPRLLEIALRRNLFDEKSGRQYSGAVRSEIEAHLENLSGPARQLLSTASLLGLEFRVYSLAHVLEQSPIELLDSIHETEQSGLLEHAEIPGVYRFRQSLVQEILNAELTGARRALLHRRFGEVMELLHSNDPSFLEPIGFHFYEAALVGGAAKAVDYCSRAAEQACNTGRLEDASHFFQMALGALEVQGTDVEAIRQVELKLEGLRSDTESGPSRVRRAAANRIDASSFNLAVNEGAALTNAEASSFFAALPPELHTLASHENAFRREGDFWTLVFQNQVLHLRHSHGLLFVAHLLQHPDRDFHVAQLVALLPSAGAAGSDAVYISRSERERLGIHPIANTDSNPLLDATAKAEYRGRIEELRDELERARRFNDLTRAADLEKELEFIALELSRAVRPGGRDRKHRAEDERARVNVTNAIRTLTQKIAKEHLAFGRYLRLTIQTGVFCSYRPDPSSTPRWRF